MADAFDPFRPLSDDERAASAQDAVQDGEHADTRPVLPPADAELAQDAAARLFRRPPDAIWSYATASGETAFHVCRWNESDGGKQILPLCWFQAAGWQFKHWMPPRPLYNLDKIAANPRAPIMVCEGEKAADAAARIFPGWVATTSSGGANAAAKTDWTPHAGRRVVLFPDADDPGAKYAREVVAILAELECELSIIDVAALAATNPQGGVREAAKGWDAADAIDEWQDLDALRKAAMGLAKPLDPNPLHDLGERVAADPGAAFVPEVLERLAALKNEDRAAFEVMRSNLKKAGCRVTALDTAISEESGDRGGRGPTQADILIHLAETADLFHAADGTGFADIDVNGHRETWPIRGKGFRRWLARRFFEATVGAPSSEALQSALNLIEARAHFDGPERVVHIRVGGLDGKLYLDLGDKNWRAVEIGDAGWRVISNPPVRFRRASGMQPLPVPIPGGSITALRSFLNLQSDADFVLVVGWALAVLRNRGPYPVIVLSGEQGSAKSTFSAILRALLDPNTAPLRALPREDRDLFIAATNGHVLAFDNVSGLPAWISDTLCRLATGGGFAVRQLYTDQDEVLFDAARPVILNGIEDVVTRPDLADRAVFLTLEPIQEERRRPEAELWTVFETERPHILGVLLDAVVEGLKRLPETHLPRLPRMADFALWATACETKLWPAGTFWTAYCSNRDDAVDGIIEADPIAAAARGLMAGRTHWKGTASDLLGALGELASERLTKARTWPESPRALAGRLRRAATFLRKIGIDIGFEREGRARTRVIRITTTAHPASTETQGPQPSASSVPSVDRPKVNAGNEFASLGLRTVGGGADRSAGGAGSTVRANPLNSNGATDADGADANDPLQSAPVGWRARL